MRRTRVMCLAHDGSAGDHRVESPPWSGWRTRPSLAAKPRFANAAGPGAPTSAGRGRRGLSGRPGQPVRLWPSVASPYASTVVDRPSGRRWVRGEHRSDPGRASDRGGSADRGAARARCGGRADPRGARSDARLGCPGRGRADDRAAGSGGRGRGAAGAGASHCGRGHRADAGGAGRLAFGWRR